MSFQIEIEEERAVLKRLADSEVKLKQLLWKKNLAKQDILYDALALFEPATISGKNASEKLLEKSKATARALDDFDEKFLMIGAPGERNRP